MGKGAADVGTCVAHEGGKVQNAPRSSDTL